MRNEIPVPPEYTPPPPPPPQPLRKRRTRLYLGIVLVLILVVLSILGLIFFIFPKFIEVLTIPKQREVLINVWVESDTIWSGVIYKQDETIPIQIATGNQTLGYILRGSGQLYFGLQLKKATDYGYLRVTVYNSSETDPETGKSKVLGTDETTEPYGMVTLSIMV